MITWFDGKTLPIFYFQKKCRDMKCFPGKTPVNGSCLPLLRESTNLSYALSAEFTLEKSETNCSRVAKIVLRFLQRECFKDLIYSVINGTKLYALALAVYLQPCKNTSTLLGDISGVLLSTFLPTRVSDVLNLRVISINWWSMIVFYNLEINSEWSGRSIPKCPYQTWH